MAPAGSLSKSLPSQPTPKPPPEFAPAPTYSAGGYRPRQAEVAHAPQVIDDLKSFRDYAEIFGRHAPAPDEIVGLLERARSWREQRDAAAAWSLYVRTQDSLAWHAALATLDQLKPFFQLAAEREPELATKYQHLAAFFDTHKNIAKRAGATKAKKKSAQADAERKAADSSETASERVPET